MQSLSINKQCSPQCSELTEAHKGNVRSKAINTVFNMSVNYHCNISFLGRTIRIVFTLNGRLPFLLPCDPGCDNISLEMSSNSEITGGTCGAVCLSPSVCVLLQMTVCFIREDFLRASLFGVQSTALQWPSWLTGDCKEVSTRLPDQQLERRTTVAEMAQWGLRKQITAESLNGKK